MTNALKKETEIRDGYGGAVGPRCQATPEAALRPAPPDLKNENRFRPYYTTVIHSSDAEEWEAGVVDYILSGGLII